jgi:hypothetical protein
MKKLFVDGIMGYTRALHFIVARFMEGFPGESTQMRKKCLAPSRICQQCQLLSLLSLAIFQLGNSKRFCGRGVSPTKILINLCLRFYFIVSC